MRGQPNNNGAGAGFTLVEMMVVIIIVSIMSAAVVAEMHGTLQEALLRTASRELSIAFNAASSRAISVNMPHRIDIDTLRHRYSVERGQRGSEDFYPVRDVPLASGTIDPRISIRVLAPGLNAPDDAGDESAESAGDQNILPLMPGQEGVTFYPDGTADSRQIELTDRDGFRLALRVNPITSRVQITTLPHS
ncbi:MAG TPA: prepilin-type N-terminal cleavage/methylation domain-containing protein [Verrucomicrobiae bacterium]|jgi:type II secretion system protein H